MLRRKSKNNSVIAPHAVFEFQLELFFDLENQKFGISPVLIDVSGKDATVILGFRILGF